MVNKLTKVSAALSLVAVAGMTLASTAVSAAGVAITVTPSAVQESTAGNVTLAYTPSSALADGDVITVSLDTGYAGSDAITDLNVTVEGIAPTTVVNTTDGTAEITINGAIVTAAAGDVDVVFTGLTTPAVTGNYALFVMSTGGDYGANFQYVGTDATESQNVHVHALIPLTLSFLIAESANGTVATNDCHLTVGGNGVGADPTTSSLSTCDYRLVVSTNAQNGYVINYQVDAAFTNGTHTMTAGDKTGVVTAGTEEYGVIVDAGSATSTAVPTIGGDMDAANAVSYESTGDVLVLTVAGPNDATADEVVNSAKVTHQLAISPETPSGYYEQVVTYTVTPTF